MKLIKWENRSSAHVGPIISKWPIAGLGVSFVVFEQSYFSSAAVAMSS